ncbi:hypothetical protein BCR39DRAFT_515176 [Naematelia encephala]|uniref:Uncharacterized protein n=1 Tax=Naematelia encephala TaxID=71784 RepID=A0A1Y2BJB0_9TREE|nr:hypothetical protein BCR39DRAFT_515176 [Naematelia encephala]
MDLYSSIVDIIFLIAIIFISYKTPLSYPIPLALRNTNTETATDPPHSASTPTSPNLNMVVPTITITPDRPVTLTPDRPASIISDRQVTITSDRAVSAMHHKRKSVSFSLSSIEELHDPIIGSGKNKRPPTPFVLNPPIVLSPSSSPVPSLPGTPMGDSRLAIDPMGVEKRWLMG